MRVGEKDFMFTGLVETVGRVRRRAPGSAGVRLELETAIGPLTLGESVSVSGACLTVVAMDASGFAADVSVETLERTTLGDLASGDRVNLERALAAGARLGGHLVTGHVDGIAVVTAVEASGEARRVTLEAPAPLSPFLAEKGSVALDGVSLTVNGARGSTFEVMLIPHTLSMTTLASLAAGRRLNLEVDLVARYVVRYLEATREAAAGPDLEETLRKSGYIR